ncbi:hypothetical protein J8273_4282 [Carpediemonas membranifera]|nr:hypothetical protein J8273_4282 [Carpediemonas membranifera]|eukprot:KAG9394180.1 hypothetical protein J8273_4282 [Carpediemonas membranifera]
MRVFSTEHRISPAYKTIPFLITAVVAVVAVMLVVSKPELLMTESVPFTCGAIAGGIIMMAALVEAAAEPFLGRCLLADSIEVKTHADSLAETVRSVITVAVAIGVSAKAITPAWTPACLAATQLAASLTLLAVFATVSRSVKPQPRAQWGRVDSQFMTQYTLNSAQRLVLAEGERAVMAFAAPSGAFSGAWALSATLSGMPVKFIFAPIDEQVALRAARDSGVDKLGLLRMARLETYIAFAAVALGCPLTPLAMSVVFPTSGPDVVRAVQLSWLALPLFALNGPFENIAASTLNPAQLRTNNALMFMIGLISIGTVWVGSHYSPAACIALGLGPLTLRLGTNAAWFTKSGRVMDALRAMVDLRGLAVLALLGGAATAISRADVDLLPQLGLSATVCGLGVVPLMSIALKLR